MNFVIGSGPAGIAASAALLARGEPVTMVDAGITLEPERRAITARMGRQRPDEWSPADVARMKEGMDAGRGGVVLKRVYGSDFAYRGPAEHIAIQSAQAALMPSLAQGGLSNVWGAAMLPYSQRDLAGWPVSAEELAPHYAAVLRLTGLAAQADDLEALFPLHTEDYAPLPMSRQATRLWQRLEDHRATLQARGLHFGAARLAVRARRAPESDGCVVCGMCMYGCPYDYIYSSTHTLQRWGQREGFTYLPGIVVERAEETGGGITLTGYELHSRRPWRVTGERVFLGAGVLPSTKILLSSQDAYGRALPILDSQYFLFPLVQARGTAGVRAEALYTLSQIFLEILDPALSPHTVHLQVYSYNDLIGAAMKSTLGPLGFDPLVRELEGRMLIVQGYLHSDHSSRVCAELRPGRDRGILHVAPAINLQTSSAVRRVVRKLVRQAGLLGALALEPLLQIAPPGRGFHSGGSLPMCAQPGPWQTDPLGRPAGWTRLHIVDSTVFPTIPATTITFSVMANAHRIASAVA
jgi:choline dehydrogenase-like flavoprotein